jgi:NADH-quinone oxidoreductase subunit C
MKPVTRSETTGMPRHTTSPRVPVVEAPPPSLQDMAQRITAAHPDAVLRTEISHGDLTVSVDRGRLLELAQWLRDEPSLRFEVLASLSGVDYLLEETRLHVAYHLLSMTHRHRVRLEVALTIDDPHVPSVMGIWPTADWQERETWDFFGVVFDGHPDLTRIEMPDDWEGHPQRKDYPLGGIPIEYKGAQIAPPDDRRGWA